MIRVIKMKMATLVNSVLVLLGISTAIHSSSILMTILTLFLAAAALFDLCSREIPLWLIILAFGLWLIISLFIGFPSGIQDSLIGGVAAFSAVGMLILVTKGQVGMGDLLVMTVTGLYTGISQIPGILFLSVIITGFFSVLLLIFKEANVKHELPFTPFILIATVFLISF